MKVLGITGGIASGKSTIARFFETLGHPLFEADNVAKDLMTTSLPLIEQIKELLGLEAYRGADLDRRFIAETIFSNPDLRTKLNAIVHPAVESAFEIFKTVNSSYAYVVYEAALIREDSKEDGFDKLIVAHASQEVRIKRIMARDPYRSEEEIKGIIDAQYSDEEVMQGEHIVDVFTGDESLITMQLLDVDQELREEEDLL